MIFVVKLSIVLGFFKHRLSDAESVSIIRYKGFFSDGPLRNI
jgi:hypothetical protein